MTLMYTGLKITFTHNRMAIPEWKTKRKTTQIEKELQKISNPHLRKTHILLTDDEEILTAQIRVG